jgi:2-polyprenyl-3-methyl-5-hydroxy-6-metoxy-1,4-benzoquinol methylase
MVSFFKTCLTANGPFQQCLEIGAGHGIFTAEVMRSFPRAEMTVVDISQTSIDLTRQMLNTFEVDDTRVRFVHDNFLTMPPHPGGFDFIIMGEVLEHVNDAPQFMSQARELLRPDGKIFMTTCANCPAVDHVYHFHSVPEIRHLIGAAHLIIARELVLPVHDVPEAKWQEELTTINYAAVLTLPEK